MENQLEERYYQAKIKHLEASIQEKEANVAKILTEIKIAKASEQRTNIMFQSDFLIKFSQLLHLQLSIDVKNPEAIPILAVEKGFAKKLDRVLEAFFRL